MPAVPPYQTGQGVGARLRSARLAKKYTQQQLARPDFSVSYISAIERGQIQPSLRALEILARRLELNTAELLPANVALMSVSSSEDVGAMSRKEEQELLLLEAQIAIHQKNPEQAIHLVQGLLPHKGKRNEEKTSAIPYILGWAYLEAGQLEESELMLAEAARLAREALDPLYPCILGLQSAVYSAMHNVEQARQLQRESLRVFEHQTRSSQNVVFLARLHAHLARHYHSLGEFAEAREQFQQTLHLFSLHHSYQQKQEHYQVLLADYAAREQYVLADLYGQKWLVSNFCCQLPAITSELTYALGRILLRNNPDEARNYLQRIMQEAEVRQNHLLLTGAQVQLAFWLFRTEEWSQAEELLSHAQTRLAACGETLITADARLLAGELAYKRQDYSLGDRCFEEGLALFEKVGVQGDYIEHLTRYAQLLEERNCIQRSLFYWKLAFEQRKKDHMLIL